MTRKYFVNHLGCPKNLVDGEGMEQLLIERGYEKTDNPAEAETLIVNTCGFIKAAEDESLAALDELAREKRPDQVLIAAGCLAQRRGDSLRQVIPTVDGILGAMRWNEVGDLLAAVRQGVRPTWTGFGPISAPPQPNRVVVAPSAYLKIADGCDHTCSFCAIPLIKGKHRSKSIDLIVSETRELVEKGVQEVVFVSQDSSGYGKDFGMRDGLAELLDRVCTEVPELPWLRVMYVYPGTVSSRLIETFARHRQIVKYIDMPLQHAHPEMLTRMRRPRQDLRKLISDLREGIPDLALRSTFIVGFPGETEQEFSELLAFLNDVKMDRVGVFQYSPEEGTRAEPMPDQVPKHVKERRYRQVMLLLQKISLKRNRAQVGRTLDVLIEGDVEPAAPGENSPYGSVGRSYRDAPEVDGMVFIRERVPIGTIVPVRIVAAMEYDLVGHVSHA